MRYKALLLMMFLLPLHTFAQNSLKPRITVFPLENPSSDVQIDIISHNVKNTAELNLKMLDKYNVISVGEESHDMSSGGLISFCEKNSIDNVLFGKSVLQPDGSVDLEMSVFSREEGKVTLTENEKADTLFDIFAASDRLVVALMQSFSGTHMGFGSIVLKNAGSKGLCQVYIDDIYIGENIEKISKILNGKRIIKIKQERMFGEYIVKEDKILVIEDETTFIEFDIPGFLDEELDAVAEHEKVLDKYISDKSKEKKVNKAFDSLGELLAVTDYSDAAENKKEEIAFRRTAWEALPDADPGGIKNLSFNTRVGGGSDLMLGLTKRVSRKTAADLMIGFTRIGVGDYNTFEDTFPYGDPDTWDIDYPSVYLTVNIKLCCYFDFLLDYIGPSLDILFNHPKTEIYFFPGINLGKEFNFGIFRFYIEGIGVFTLNDMTFIPSKAAFDLNDITFIPRAAFGVRI